MVETYNSGDVIFRQGDNAETMYDVLSGKVGIYVNYGAPDEKKLTELELGQFFGEMGVIECYPRSATAVALADGTRVQCITMAEFTDYFSNKPERLLLIMRQLSKRVRERTEDYQFAVKTLEELKRSNGASASGGGKGLLARILKSLSMYDTLTASGEIPYQDAVSGDPFLPF